MTEDHLWVRKVGDEGQSSHIVKGDDGRTMCGLLWVEPLWEYVELEPNEKSCETCLRVAEMRER
jgi:hypothetical protein